MMIEILILAGQIVMGQHAPVPADSLIVIHSAQEIDDPYVSIPMLPCTRSLVPDEKVKGWPERWHRAKCQSPRFVLVSIEGGGYFLIDREAGEAKRCKGRIIDTIAPYCKEER